MEKDIRRKKKRETLNNGGIVAIVEVFDVPGVKEIISKILRLKPQQRNVIIRKINGMVGR
jgi:hypothetical protein